MPVVYSHYFGSMGLGFRGGSRVEFWQWDQGSNSLDLGSKHQGLGSVLGFRVALCE